MNFIFPCTTSKTIQREDIPIGKSNQRLNQSEFLIYLTTSDKWYVSKPSSLGTKPLEAIDLIYGGVASAASTVTQIPAPPKTANTKTTSWSRSLQTLLEQPPATLPQRLITGGMVFCFAFGTWAWFGQIEEVGTAQGKLVPKGETYKIEPLALGKVSKVLIEEGEAVQAGQILVELDTELAQKEVERLEQMLTAYRLELSHKQNLLERVSLETKTLAAIAASDTLAQRSLLAAAREKVVTTRILLTQLRSEAAAYQARQVEFKQLISMAQNKAEQLRSEVKAHRERLQRLSPLEKEGAISKEFVFEAEQAWRQSQQRLTESLIQEITQINQQLFQAERSSQDIAIRIAQSKGELTSAQKEVERLEAQLSQKQAQERKIQLEAQQKIQQLKLESSQIEAKIAETENLLVAAKTKLKQKFLKAPVDGIVSSLDLQNPGKVIQAGQTVAEIAPNGVPLVLSAFLSNREAGFVKEGMPVQIKFDAYPYQDYGIISGKVISISADAEPHEQLGQVYRVNVELEQDYISSNQQKIEFKAGQTANADIVIRRRRIADVLLEPIRQLQKDGINL